jgi:hypothetical protein
MDDQLWASDPTSEDLAGFETIVPDECVHGGHGPSDTTPGVIYVRPGRGPWPGLVRALRERGFDPGDMRYIEWGWDTESVIAGAMAMALYVHGAPRGLRAIRWFPLNRTTGVVEARPPLRDDDGPMAFTPNAFVVVGYVDLPRLPTG